MLSAWLMIEMSPLVPLTLQLLLPLPCHCSVAEVEGGATLIEGPRQGDVETDVATEVNRGRERVGYKGMGLTGLHSRL